MIRKLRKGFTIVELVIVIAVIAVLTAVLVPTFVHLSKKAKVASDQSLVANLNTALKMEQGETGKAPKTMHDAVKGLKNQGYYLPQLVTKSGEELVYSIEKNEFSLSSNIDSSKKADYWHIQSDATNNGWSIYAFNWSSNAAGTSENPLVTGFDAGDEEISSIYFGGGNDAVIRTNSASTTLVVDDASEGTIYHYGSAGALNIIQCHTASYHEYGKVAFAEIGKGRIVLENGSQINHIHVNKKENAQEFDTIIIQDNGAESLPKAITRDEITLEASESKDVVKVVASNGQEETVKVYGSNAQGSTEKTGTQNSSIATKLGELVLDNGESNKALAPEDKADVKEEAVEELITDEIAEESVDYVARIGTVGYESFNDAVENARPGEKIVLIRSFELKSSIGVYGDIPDNEKDGWNIGNIVGGLKNEVVLSNDITITFKGASKIYLAATYSVDQYGFIDGLTDFGKFTLNGNKLTLATGAGSNLGAGIDRCQNINESDYQIAANGNAIVNTDLSYTGDMYQFINFVHTDDDEDRWLASGNITAHISPFANYPVEGWTVDDCDTIYIRKNSLPRFNDTIKYETGFYDNLPLKLSAYSGAESYEWTMLEGSDLDATIVRTEDAAEYFTEHEDFASLFVEGTTANNFKQFLGGSWDKCNATLDIKGTGSATIKVSFDLDDWGGVEHYDLYIKVIVY